ncbi:MAG: hypothetical protein ACM3NO_02870 [Deltaproteobacteria bacterium]
MGQDGHFENCASVVLGLVSLVLALHQARTHVIPRLNSNAEVTAHRSDTAVPRITPQRRAKNGSDSPNSQTQAHLFHKESSKVAVGRSPIHSRKDAVSQASEVSAKARTERNPSSELASDHPSPRTEKALVEIAESVAAPPPPTRTFENLGYVEKADGTKQAIVSKGDQVFVVHEGEIFDEHYRVLSITSSQVEAADLTIPLLPPAAPPEPTVLAKQSTLPIPSRKADEPAQALVDAKPLGFVERPGRPPEAIVTDGDSVRLVARAALAGNSPADSMSVASTRDDISPASSSAGFANAETSAVVNEAPDDILSDAGLIATASDSDYGLSPPASSDHSSSGPGYATIRNFAVRGSPLVSNPTRAGPAQSLRRTLKAFCYVERPSTGREAFVALGDAVYSAREGTFIANRYRVLAIRPEGVQVEETDFETRPPPGPDQEVAQNRAIPDGIAELSNHPPPAALPVDGLVRSVAFVLTDFAGSEVARGPEPRQSTQNLVKPTIKDLLSSISNVRTGPHGKTAIHNLIPDLGPQVDDSAFREAENPRGGGPTRLKAREVVKNRAGESAQGAIAFLPVKAQAGLLSLAVPAKRSRLAMVRLASDRPGVVSNGPLQPVAPNDPHVSQLPGASTLVGSTPTLTSLSEMSIISGRDLLLHFSIGDNGCYFP